MKKITKYFIITFLLLINSSAIGADTGTSFLADGGIVVTILILFVVILWILLPFAVFGVKGKLSEIIEANKETNKILYAIKDNLEALQSKEISKPVSEEH